jgi:class 3 adenylate cyclase
LTQFRPLGSSPIAAKHVLINRAEFPILETSLSEERVERRLAAVLAADVGGYSRLMGRDEERTLANLKEARRAVTDPIIAAHRGRIVKTTGDGVIWPASCR